ncbi:MAG TPA: hypothetical protein GXX72_00060 [Clostridiaceae bacterium]|jgi:hypothetical protein|nr:hypothetical protein [Clostridiaceae bacterium]
MHKIEKDVWGAIDGLGIPRVNIPDDIEEIVNYPPERLACIDDMDVANAIQYKLSQFILYVEQNVRVIRAAINGLEEEFMQELLQDASRIQPKSLSLTEKKAIAIQNSERLQELARQINQLKMRRDALDGWAENVKNLLDVIKQIYYRLRLQAYGS